MKNIITTNALSRVYGMGANATTALHPLSLEIQSGSVNVIMGKSGCGKTTLLHLLAGMDKPTAGAVLYRGENMVYMNDTVLAQLRGNKFGFIFQSFHLVPEISVFDNIALPLIFTKKKIIQKKITDLAASLGIQDKLKLFPNSLSGGEQQRVAIARAMVNNPDVIFADEPTGNLDEQNGRAVIRLLLGLCRIEGKTLVLVTHDKNLVEQPDNFFLMESGRLKAI